MYRYSLGEDSFQTRFYLLQFGLKKKDEAFCNFLGIKYYLYKPVSRLTCSFSILDEISNHLSSVPLSSFSFFQRPLFLSFLEALDEAKRELLEKEPKKEEKEGNVTKKEKERHIFLEKIQEKTEEMIKYILENSVSSISSNVLFSDGTNMQKWFEKLCYINKNVILSKEEEEVVQKSVYQIILSLYPEIEINYGSSLKRVVAYFGFTSSYLFTNLRIPSSVLNKMMDNTIIPTKEFCDTILSFLKQIPIENVYQKNLVASAIESFTRLKSLSLKGEEIPFIIYGEEKEAEYLNYFEEVDLSFLEKVREQNYDWYMKCLTYLYICKTKREKPTEEDYFYDGTIVKKWLGTQNRVLSLAEKNNFTEEQLVMLEVIHNEVRIIELGRKDESTICMEKIVYAHLDSFLDAFNEAITDKGNIQDSFLYEVSLKEAWNFLYKKLEGDDIPLTEEQIKKVKKVRYKMIYLEKKSTHPVGDITFCYELSCLVESLHLTMDQLADLFHISRSSAWKFFSNKVFPSCKIVQTMLASLNKFDFSAYRLDQIKDVEHFKSYLLIIEKRYLGHKGLNRKALFASPLLFSVTGDLVTDIPKEVIKEMQDTDLKWYKEFVRIYNDILTCSSDDTLSLGDLFLRPWFKEEAYKISIGESTKIKENLLHYLYSFYQIVCGRKKERLFLIRFSDLESFVYANKRIPYAGEIILSDGIDGEAFYRMTRDTFYGYKNYYNGLSAYASEQLKLLMQFLAICQREGYNYKPDKVVNQKFYLGQRLNNIRICLGLSVKDFPHRLEKDANGMADFYSNRKPLTYEFVSSLLHLFKEMEPNLREDQLKEVQDFISVLTTGKLDEAFALKFCKKDTNLGN